MPSAGPEHGRGRYASLPAAENSTAATVPAPCAPTKVSPNREAGRWKSDGTFGVTGDCEPFDEELVARVESHRYEPVRVAQWRNSVLDFSSAARLIESLEAPPPEKGLSRARPASDIAALKALAEDAEAMAPLTSRAEVARFWEVCQLPDFRKLSGEEHAKLVKSFAGFLARGGAIPNDWMARAVARLDESLGDVATLSGRLAHVRTLTYASNRPGWTEDAGYWQGVTRQVEDRLSDALHECLTQRFIDRRTSILMKTLRDEDFASLALDESGAVSIGGESIGRLDGLSFVPDPLGIAGANLARRRLPGPGRRDCAPHRQAAGSGRTGYRPLDEAVVGWRHCRHEWRRQLSPRVTLMADTPIPPSVGFPTGWMLAWKRG